MKVYKRLTPEDKTQAFDSGASDPGESFDPGEAAHAMTHIVLNNIMYAARFVNIRIMPNPSHEDVYLDFMY